MEEVEAVAAALAAAALEAGLAAAVVPDPPGVFASALDDALEADA